VFIPPAAGGEVPCPALGPVPPSEAALALPAAAPLTPPALLSPPESLLDEHAAAASKIDGTPQANTARRRERDRAMGPFSHASRRVTRRGRSR
jgi:hypothetical protein